MTPEHLDLLAALGRARAGVRVEVEKPYLIESRLTPLARREGFESIEALVDELRTKREERLIWAVVESLCRTDTTFFRGREAFMALRDGVLPSLSHRRDAPLRIWSAACSTGQEVYSVAMAATEATGLPPGARFEFFGSDLSERCLEKAQSGLYTQFEVQRGLPIRMLVKYFENQDDTWTISPRIRQMVRWRRINLLSDLSALGVFDVILLRNVLRNMAPALRNKVIRSLAGRLAADGVLVLDPEDNVTDLDDILVAAPGGAGLYLRDPTIGTAAAA